MIKLRDKEYMKRALELARKGLGKTSPNPAVGAVLVKEGKVIGEGYHERAGGPHAEIRALEAAGSQAQGATLYVTLEPCCHYGRTPPCTQALIEAGVKRVVVAMLDPNPRVQGKGCRILREAGIEVEVGLLEQEARRLNEAYIKFITCGLPWVTLKVACSLDGKIATRTGASRWITGEEAREKVHRLRNIHDAVLTGVGTIIADNPRLTVRLQEEGVRDPVRVILDSTLRIPLDAQVLHLSSPAPTLIATTPRAREEIKRQLEDMGVEVLTVPEEEGRVAWMPLLKELARRGIMSVLIEGGAAINASALNSRIVDKAVFFLAPKILGGEEIPAVGGRGIDSLEEAWELKDLEIELCGRDIMISGYLR